MAVESIQILLKEPQASGSLSAKNFDVVENAPIPQESDLRDQEILVKVLYLSVDPYMRPRMTCVNQSYVEGFKKGKPINGFGVAEVLASKHPHYQPGDHVTGASIPWTTFSVLNPSNQSLFSKLEGDLAKVPLQWHVGVLSMPSFTGWYGLVKIGQPKPGETLVVSAASGAVGQVVVQLGKAYGLRVVASAGSETKVEYLKKVLKADEVFNYKKVDSISGTLKKLCPKGIDIYFDNVGGEFLDAVLENASLYARIAACGAISQYEKDSQNAYRLKNQYLFFGKRISMKGFLIFDHYKDDYVAFVKDISKRVNDGEFHYKLDVTKGLENGPRAMMKLFEGTNFGKSLIEV
ncbi:hypothetical protein IWQ62_000012 [Dispira parvispora]|uniref:Enoyl reductase (ER) domain-containing protein n=1 Tax=Dispira parvispora TaxID=1520584 RepID=A0A9W8AWU1_9FUNG|nr:hypothetical protein IWQ62_000012 [Dispira parvispora]